MFKQVFDPENLLWRMVARGVDLVGLGLFWLLLCFPVVTIGPATAALYYTVVKTFRQGETNGFHLLWAAFRENLRRGCAATLICLPPCALLALGYWVMDQVKTQGSAGAVMFVAYWVALLIPAGILCWLFPILARFETGLKDAFRTAFVLTLRHLPSTFVVVLLNLYLIVFTLERWWPVFFVPVLLTLLCSLFQERVFLKYLDGAQRAALEGREEETIQDTEGSS